MLEISEVIASCDQVRECPQILFVRCQQCVFVVLVNVKCQSVVEVGNVSLSEKSRVLDVRDTRIRYGTNSRGCKGCKRRRSNRGRV